MLDDVTDDNCVGEKSNVSNIDDLKKMFKKIDDRNRIIQRSLNENGERLQNDWTKAPTFIQPPRFVLNY